VSKYAHPTAPVCTSEDAHNGPHTEIEINN